MINIVGHTQTQSIMAFLLKNSSRDRLMSDVLKVILEHTTKILEGIDEIKQMKTENKIVESNAEKENTEDVKFHELNKASYHIGCQTAGWAFIPAKLLITILAVK